MLYKLSLPSYFRIKCMKYLRRDFSNGSNTGYDSSCRIFPDNEQFLRTYFLNNTKYTRKNDRIYVRSMCHTSNCVHRVMFFTSTSNFCHRPCVGLMNNNFRRSYISINLDNVPTLSLLQIKKTLKGVGLTFDDGFTCLIMNCPLCMESSTSTSTGTSKAAQLQGKFYINKTTGMFVCHECGSSGQWEVLEKTLLSRKGKKASSSKEVEPVKKTSLVDQAVLDIQQNSQPLESFLPDEQENILKSFNLPAVTPSLEIRCNALKTALYFPLYCASGQITGFKVLKHGKGIEETTVPPVGCSGLLIPKPVKTGKQESAVLVPSVADVLALIGHRIGGQVAGLPHGITSLPLQVLPSLERYNKLILWFGDSIGSWDSARNFAKKLGEKRCFIVKATEKQPSPHVALKAGYDLRAIVNAAQPVWHQAITSFSMLREDVLSDLQNIEKVEGVKWKRYPALNRILKGHRRGEFTVLTGPTGSGKTTFMSEYSLDLAMQGVNTLWGSFEIRNARLARTMLQQMAGIPLDVHIDKFDYWADQFEQLPLYFMTFHGQQSIKVVMEAVEHAAYVHDIAHVIIDNVQFMMGVSDEPRHADRFWKQDAIIACFRSFATRKNCHVTLVIHPRKERDAEDLTVNSIFGSAKAAQEADNVLIIQDKRLSSVRGKKYLQVAKNRYSGDLGIMTLDFDKDSLSYQQKKKKVVKTESEDMDHG